MKKMEKIIVLISIVLISLLCLGAVSAADIEDDGLFIADDSQAIDSDNEIDEIIQEPDVMGEPNAIKDASPLAEDESSEDETKTFTQLITDIGDEASEVTLTGIYKFDSEVDTAYPVISRDLTINGLAIINGSDHTRLFNVTNGATLTLKNLTLCYGAADNGAGVFVESGASLVADNVNFTNNAAEESGGAIYSEGTVKLKKSRLEFNSANLGGAVSLKGGDGESIIDNSIFQFNTATSNGGAVYASTQNEGKLKFTDSQLNGNEANAGGAIYLDGVQKTVIDGCAFNDNEASDQGGAIYSRANDGTNVTIKYCDFENNLGYFGSAISNDGDLILDDNIFDGPYNSTTPIGNNGTIKSGVCARILDNQTITTSSATNTIFAWLIDDTSFCGETIIDRNLILLVDGHEVPVVYDVDTADHYANYTFTEYGSYVVSAKGYAGDELFTGTINYIRPTTLTVNVEDTIVGDIAKVEGQLISINDYGLLDTDLTVFVNNVDYNITTGQNGTFSFDVTDLPAGHYDAVAIYDGDEYYIRAVASDLFNVKIMPDLKVVIEDITYDEDASIIVTLFDGDTGLDGVVDVYINETPYAVAVADGMGFFGAGGLDAGTYTYSGILRETADFAAVGTEPKTFTVSPSTDLDIDFDVDEITYGDIINGTITINFEGEGIELENVKVAIVDDDMQPVNQTVIADFDGTYNFIYDGILDIGHYNIIITVPDQVNFYETSVVLDLDVNAKYAQAGIDLGAIDITEGETTTVYITVGEGKVYAFTSYGDDDGEIEYSTGTVLILDEDDEWTKVKVLTNDADPSYVGQEFYVESDDSFWHIHELFLDEGETSAGIFVKTHEAGVVPQDIDGTATITVTNNDGFELVIPNVQITDGKGQTELPVLALGEYFFQVNVEADGYDIEPAEFYDCLVVWVKEGTYTHLQQLIDEAIAEMQEGEGDGWIELPFDFEFDEQYDNPNFINGIVINGDIGINGDGHTISGANKARIFNITQDGVVELNDVTLTQGASTDKGAAIYSLGELKVINSVFENNTITAGASETSEGPVAGGAAIFSGQGSALEIIECNFNFNAAINDTYAPFTCGAVYAYSAFIVSIQNSNFNNNSAVLGGALTIENLDPDDTLAYNCYFTGNIAWQGGAINLYKNVSNAGIIKSTFWDNEAVGESNANGGAIMAGTSDYGTDVFINDCSFDENDAYGDGGAIYLNHLSTLVVYDTEFTANLAEGDGGAIFTSGNTEVDANVLFECNVADNGGAIYFNGEKATIYNSQFDQNDPDNGGGLYIANGTVELAGDEFIANTVDGDGGAIYLAKDGNLVVNNTGFYENTAESGGAIYAESGSALTINQVEFEGNDADDEGYGGAIYLGANNAIIYGTDFICNYGGNGSAIYWAGNNGVLNSSYFRNNKANKSGGAIYWTGESGTIEDSMFELNLAAENGAALMSTGADMTIIDSAFYANTANSDGAIYFLGNDADLTEDHFQDSNALGSGAIVVDGASIKVDDCFFENNVGVVNEYNIHNAGTIESITDSSFSFITPTISVDDHTFGEDIVMSGNFDWGVKQPEITMKFTINGEERTATVHEGQYSTYLDDLAPGTYTVVISSFQDENNNYYEVRTEQRTFVLNKATAQIYVTGDEIFEGDVALVEIDSIDVEIPVPGIAIVTVNGVDYAVNITNTGSATLAIHGLPYGEYPITAKFLGNNHYKEIDYTGDAKIVVKSEKITFDLAINDNNTVITVSNAKNSEGENISGSIFGTLFKDGEKIGELDRTDLVNGTGTIDIPDGLELGDYVVEIEVLADNHARAYQNISFTVTPSPDARVTVVADSYTFFDENAYLHITVMDINGNFLNGMVSTFIDGVNFDVLLPVVNGKALSRLEGLSPGDHLATVKFFNSSYVDAGDEDYFTVGRAPANLTVSADSIKEGEVATVKVTLIGVDMGTYLDGIVLLTVGDVEYAVEVTDGEGSIDIKNLAASTYHIDAHFIGTDLYDEKLAGSSFEVSKYSSVNAYVIGGVESVFVTLTDSEGEPVDGNVNVTVDGETKEYAVVDGQVAVPITGTGEKEVIVSYPGDDTHAPVTVNKTVNVLKPKLLDTEIVVTATNITYGDKAVIDFALTDINGKALNGVLNVTVGEEVEEVTVTKGKGSVTISNLNAGIYPVVANYDGNSAYAASTGAGDFNVAKNASMIEYKDMTTKSIDYVLDGRYGEYFNFTLRDANGNPLANKFIQIGFNGKIYNRTTDENGKSRLQINLKKADLYTFAVCFLGDENYNASFVVAKITVVTQTPKLTVPNKSYKASAKTKTLTATFKSARGTLLAKKKITFTVNGKTYSATTDSKGVAKVNVSISKKGTYNFTAKFAGDMTYAAITTKATLKIT